MLSFGFDSQNKGAFFIWCRIQLLIIVVESIKYWHDQPLKRWNIFVQTMETKSFFSIWNHNKSLGYSSFRCIWVPMLWVYGHYKYSSSYSEWIDFSIQYKVDPRAERVKISSRWRSDPNGSMIFKNAMKWIGL